MDDLIILSSSAEEHARRLENVLQRLDEANLQLQPAPTWTEGHHQSDISLHVLQESPGCSMETSPQEMLQESNAPAMNPGRSADIP